MSCTYRKSLLIRSGLASSTSLKIALAWETKRKKCWVMQVIAPCCRLSFPLFIIIEGGNLIWREFSSIHRVKDDDVFAFASPLNNLAANRDTVTQTFSWQTEEAYLIRGSTERSWHKVKVKGSESDTSVTRFNPAPFFFHLKLINYQSVIIHSSYLVWFAGSHALLVPYNQANPIMLSSLRSKG